MLLDALTFQACCAGMECPLEGLQDIVPKGADLPRCAKDPGKDKTYVQGSSSRASAPFRLVAAWSLAIIALHVPSKASEQTRILLSVSSLAGRAFPQSAPETNRLKFKNCKISRFQDTGAAGPGGVWPVLLDVLTMPYCNRLNVIESAQEGMSFCEDIGNWRGRIYRWHSCGTTHPEGPQRACI
jgi:hypothetical protein